MSLKVSAVLLSLMLLAVFSSASAQEGYYFVDKWGNECSTNCQFRSPRALTIGPSGDVYILDGDNYMIKQYSSNGVFIRKWGSWGQGPGQFSDPRGMAVDSSGHIYVTDYSSYFYVHRVQKFSPDGAFIREWGSEGSGEGQFVGPKGIGIDSLGYVYVSDSGNSRVQKFTSEGVFVHTWGTSGDGNGQFAITHGAYRRWIKQCLRC